jgi:hypothetical protein
MAETVVITACTNRKRLPPAAGLRACELPAGSVEEVAGTWLGLLARAEVRVPAERLYCGRAFKDAAAAARAAGASLLVVSAGLGLVGARDPAPGYSLTVAPASPDNIMLRLPRGTSVTEWWRAIVGPAALGAALAGVGALDRRGPILVALPSGYLGMIGDDLLGLPEQARARVRLFGRSIAEDLHPTLRPLAMPYDGRLDDPASPARGTGSDFGPRALRHFVERVRPAWPDGSVGEHREAVEAALAGWRAPVAPHRSRLADQEVRALIRAHWEDAGGRSSRMLRLLRDRLSVACEQGRFRDLFRAVRDEREARP